MVMAHAVHLKVFDTDDPEMINDLSAFLVSEIVAPEGNPFMDTCNHVPMPLPFRAPKGLFGMLALYFGKGLFFLAEKARVLNFFRSGEDSERLQADVYSDLFRAFGQTFRFHFTGKAGIPLAGTAALDGQCFDFPSKVPMQDDLDMTDARSKELALCIDLKATLRIGQAIIAINSTEAGIARLHSCEASAKERFEGQIETHSHILQDLRVNRVQRGALLFQHRIGGLLLITRQALPLLLIRAFAFFKQMVIEPTTLMKCFVEPGLLLLRWENAVLKHFTHTHIMRLNATVVNRARATHPLPQRRNAPDIPMVEARGFTARLW